MSGTSLQIIAILVLILANGLFALSEIAIASSRKARLRQHEDEGSRKASKALELANNPNQFLSTVQVGMTVIATLAGAFGGVTLAGALKARLDAFPLLSRYSEPVAVGVVVAAISYVSLILGELVPKRVALSNPERFAMAVAPTMRLLSRLVSPVVTFLSWSTEIVLHAFRLRHQTEPPVTEEEIKLMIEEGTEAGAFEEAEQEMIEGVFGLGDRRVAELMRPSVDMVWLDIQDSPEVILATIKQSTYSRFPVGEGSLDHVLGYIHVKDLLGLYIEGHPLDVRSCIRPLPPVPDTMPALKVLEVFQQSRTHIALVVNEHGATEGLITMHDILEAVVGDLPAPGEPAEQHVIRREDGSWLVDGATPVFEFKAALDIKELPGEDDGSFTTLGGFVLAQLGRIPSPGDKFEAGARCYEVMDMDRNRVDKVLVSDVPPQAAEAAPEEP